MKTSTIILILSVVVSMQSIAMAQVLKTSIDKIANSSQPPMNDMLSKVYGEGAKQYNLGYHYLYGEGVKQSNAEAKKWFDLAAKSNSPAVRYKIGRLYEAGVIYQKDINKAVFHYEFAAKKGEIYALNNLAILYLQGEGVIRDVDKGVSFAKKAALRGNAEAQVNLGLVYLNGTGVPIDKRQALKWFKQAAKQKNTEALYYVAQYHLSNKEFLAAFDYLNKAANLEHSNAQLKLAMLYDKGLGTEKNHTQSLIWLNESAKLGNKKAIDILKRMGE